MSHCDHALYYILSVRRTWAESLKLVSLELNGISELCSINMNLVIIYDNTYCTG